MTDAEGPDPFTPASLGPVRLRNRIVKAATFEGLTREHVVNDALIGFHRAVAAGGVGMTTLAYCAVSPDGCGTPNELILTPELTPGLARLADAVHAEGAAVSAQIGHAGAVAAGTGLQGLSPSPVFSPLAMKRTKAVTADQIRRIVDDFAAGARSSPTPGSTPSRCTSATATCRASSSAPGSTSERTSGAGRSRTGPGSPGRS